MGRFTPLIIFIVHIHHEKSLSRQLDVYSDAYNEKCNSNATFYASAFIHYLWLSLVLI